MEKRGLAKAHLIILLFMLTLCNQARASAPEVADYTQNSVVKNTLKGDIDPRNGVIDPYSVRFTQSSISAVLSSGGTVNDTIKGLRAWVRDSSGPNAIDPGGFPPIRIFIDDGDFFSVDNRRLYIFQQAGIPIKYEIMVDDDAIKREAFKFTTLNDGREIIVRMKKTQCPENP